MFVRRTDDNCFDSIHLDNCVTGANAIASSVDGNGIAVALDRTNLSARSRAGETTTPGIAGFQMVAGESVAAMASLRGPVRRSRYGASDCRHVSAACWRSGGVIVTCINFSASANVAGVTS